jgi:chemotaxis protein CheD
MEVFDIKVGIADLNTSSAPNRLITIGLGSCIGIALYDKRNAVGGLSHIMLPDSTQFKDKKVNPYKFADLAIPILVEKMEQKGAKKGNMVAKIAGGASMFNFQDKSMIMDVGSRNSTMVKKVLNDLKIPIIGEDIGGNKGRTIILDSQTGILYIRVVGSEIKEF